MENERLRAALHAKGCQVDHIPRTMPPASNPTTPKTPSHARAQPMGPTTPATSSLPSPTPSPAQTTASSQLDQVVKNEDELTAMLREQDHAKMSMKYDMSDKDLRILGVASQLHFY